MDRTLAGVLERARYQRYHDATVFLEQLFSDRQMLGHEVGRLQAEIEDYRTPTHAACGICELERT